MSRTRPILLLAAVLAVLAAVARRLRSRDDTDVWGEATATGQLAPDLR